MLNEFIYINLYNKLFYKELSTFSTTFSTIVFSLYFNEFQVLFTFLSIAQSNFYYFLKIEFC